MCDLGHEDDNKSLSISDVIYRRHFGMKSDELKLLPHLNKNGLKLTLDKHPNINIDNAEDDRALISPSSSLLTSEADAVVIVDTFSTGALLANMLYKMGLKVSH